MSVNLTPGTEFTVRGEGRFRFERLADGGSSVTCWGPVTSSRRSWRTFRLTRIARIHRIKKGRS